MILSRLAKIAASDFDSLYQKELQRILAVVDVFLKMLDAEKTKWIYEILIKYFIAN